MNVIRVNASHGTPELRAGWIAAVRQAADAAGVPVAVLWDLQGPRIRVGKLAEPRELLPGETVVFAPEEVARGAELPTTYADLAADVRPGARILLDDGLLSVQVTRIAPPRVEGRVEDGGTLTSNKGMNLPGCTCPRRRSRKKIGRTRPTPHPWGRTTSPSPSCAGRKTSRSYGGSSPPR